MGAYAPVYPAAPGDEEADGSDLIDIVADRIIEPTLGALRDLGTPFRGVLYAGLMITESGPKVVEFNCRMGDPEAQVILPLTPFPLLPLMRAVAAGDSIAAPRRDVAVRQYAVATVLAADGYPDTPRVGDVIRLPGPEAGIHVFHAGTARNDVGELVTAAGRVLAVTALASDLADAQRASAAYAARVQFSGKHFRTDIAWRELARHARAS
jgi:phosphoribosylamine--glycine ligase